MGVCSCAVGRTPVLDAQVELQPTTATDRTRDAVPSYDCGSLWVNDINGDIEMSVDGKAAGLPRIQSGSSSPWHSPQYQEYVAPVGRPGLRRSRHGHGRLHMDQSTCGIPSSPLSICSHMCCMIRPCIPNLPAKVAHTVRSSDHCAATVCARRLAWTWLYMGPC